MKQDGRDRLIRARIRALRTARGWSLDTLASKAHLSPSNLSRIETGERRIAVDQLVQLAQTLAGPAGRASRRRGRGDPSGAV